MNKQAVSETRDACYRNSLAGYTDAQTRQCHRTVRPTENESNSALKEGGLAVINIK